MRDKPLHIDRLGDAPLKIDQLDSPEAPGGIVARPVVHRGVAMRSTLEGRWARFFDSLALDWLYEPEGFRLGGDGYYPDFYLAPLRIYVEIKGAAPPETAYRKAARLAAQTGHSVYMLVGDPSPTTASVEFAPFDAEARDNAALVAALRDPKRYGIDLPANATWLDPGTFLCDEYGLSLSKGYGWSRGRSWHRCATCGRTFLDAMIAPDGGGACACVSERETPLQSWPGRPWSRYDPALVVAYGRAAAPWIDSG